VLAGTAIQALAMLSYAAVSGVGQFFAAATMVTIGAQAASAARGALASIHRVNRGSLGRVDAKGAL
jgi:hypothetical protein